MHRILLSCISLALGYGAIGQNRVAETSLTLPELLSNVSNFHPKLLTVRQEVEAAKGKAQEKRGAFDPIFTFGSDLLRYNSTSTPGKSSSASQSEAVLEVTTPSGLKYFSGFRYNQGQVKSPASSTGDLGEYFGGVKLPLLRGNGLNEKAVAETQARIGIEVAEQTVATFRLLLLKEGATSYWEWVAASERLMIAGELLNIAKVRADAIRRRESEGDLPRIDSVEAQTEVKRREGGVVKSQRDFQKAEFKLRFYVWDATGEMKENLGTAPKISREPGSELLGDLALAQKFAVEKRPEILSFLPVERTLTLARNLARNDRRPTLDIGLGPGVDTGAGSVGPTWKLSLLYSIPFRQNAVDGRIEELDSKLRKLVLDQRLVVQQVKLEVADAFSAVETSQQRVAIAQEELDLARQLEQGERRRFELGEGTLFLLNQRERATAEVASRFVDLLAELEVAKFGLLVAMGNA